MKDHKGSYFSDTFLSIWTVTDSRAKHKLLVTPFSKPKTRGAGRGNEMGEFNHPSDSEGPFVNSWGKCCDIVLLTSDKNKDFMGFGGPAPGLKWPILGTERVPY